MDDYVDGGVMEYAHENKKTKRNPGEERNKVCTVRMVQGWGGEGVCALHFYAPPHAPHAPRHTAAHATIHTPTPGTTKTDGDGGAEKRREDAAFRTRHGLRNSQSTVYIVLNAV